MRISGHRGGHRLWEPSWGSSVSEKKKKKQTSFYSIKTYCLKMNFLFILRWNPLFEVFHTVTGGWPRVMAAFLRRTQRPSIIHDAFAQTVPWTMRKESKKNQMSFNTLEGLFTSACRKSADVQRCLTAQTSESAADAVTEHLQSLPSSAPTAYSSQSWQLLNPFCCSFLWLLKTQAD